MSLFCLLRQNANAEVFANHLFTEDRFKLVPFRGYFPLRMAHQITVWKSFKSSFPCGLTSKLTHSWVHLFHLSLFRIVFHCNLLLFCNHVKHFCAGPLILMWLPVSSSPLTGSCGLPLFTDGETEAQRGQASCSASHSSEGQRRTRGTAEAFPQGAGRPCRSQRLGGRGQGRGTAAFPSASPPRAGEGQPGKGTCPPRQGLGGDPLKAPGEENPPSQLVVWVTFHSFRLPGMKVAPSPEHTSLAPPLPPL